MRGGETDLVVSSDGAEILLIRVRKLPHWKFWGHYQAQLERFGEASLVW